MRKFYVLVRKSDMISIDNYKASAKCIIAEEHYGTTNYDRITELVNRLHEADDANEIRKIRAITCEALDKKSINNVGGIINFSNDIKAYDIEIDEVCPIGGNTYKFTEVQI